MPGRWEAMALAMFIGLACGGLSLMVKDQLAFMFCAPFLGYFMTLVCLKLRRF